MKIVGRKVNRSNFYHLINSLTPHNHASNARLDTWGSLLVVALSVGGVSLVRLLLSFTQ